MKISKAIFAVVCLCAISLGGRAFAQLSIDPPDADHDGVIDTADNCPEVKNGTCGSEPNDCAELIGFALSKCLDENNNCDIDESGTASESERALGNQKDTDGDDIGDACDESDVDQDGVADEADNCIERYNPSQRDADSDEVGDMCDNCVSVANTDQADANSNNRGDACDVNTIIPNPDTNIPLSPGLPIPANYLINQGSGGCQIAANIPAAAPWAALFLAATPIILAIRRKS